MSVEAGSSRTGRDQDTVSPSLCGLLAQARFLQMAAKTVQVAPPITLHLGQPSRRHFLQPQTHLSLDDMDHVSLLAPTMWLGVE